MPLTAWQLRRREAPAVQRVSLPTPPQVNNRLRPGKTAAGKVKLYLSAESRGYKKQVELLCLKLVPHPFPTRIRIRMIWLMGALERGDIDNRVKPLLDVLKGHAYSDDRQVRELHVYAEETARPHGIVHITITKLRGYCR